MFLSAADDAVHALLYYGPFDLNFTALSREATTYRDEGRVVRAADRPRTTVDSVKFRYMRRDDEFVAVGVERRILLTPVRLVAERHTDGNHFAGVVSLGNESAKRLLEDIISANPKSGRTLAPLLWGLSTCWAGGPWCRVTG